MWGYEGTVSVMLAFERVSVFNIMKHSLEIQKCTGILESCHFINLAVHLSIFIFGQYMYYYLVFFSAELTNRHLTSYDTKIQKVSLILEGQLHQHRMFGIKLFFLTILVIPVVITLWPLHI